MWKIGKNPLVYFLVLIGLAAQPLWSGDIQVSASVDRTEVAVNESIQLTITISGSGDLPGPQAPDLSAFAVNASGQSRNISIVNGQMSSSVSHNYILNPRQTGSFTIGSFEVSANGQNFKTQPINVTVSNAPQSVSPPSNVSAGSNHAPGAFVELELDKKRAYVNEGIILTFRFYCRLRLLSNPAYQPPEAPGCLLEDLPPPRSFFANHEGQQYRVTELKTAFFPTQAGKLTIQSPSIRMQVADRSGGGSEDDFFAQFFGARAKEYMLKREPVTLTILPLPPENKPQNFSGGVGNFRINASADKTTAKVGESLTLNVSIEGTGNIQSLGDPEFPPFNGFRKYDTASSIQMDKSAGKVEGKKSYKIILVPQSPGKRTIAPIALSYFDLAAKQYKTLRTAPIDLDLLSGATSGVMITPNVALRTEIKKVEQDIRYIKTLGWEKENYFSLLQSPLKLPVPLIPIAGLMAAGLFRFRRRFLEKNPGKRRFLNAYTKAKKELKSMEPVEGNSAEESGARLTEILLNYFADRMLQQPQGLTLRKITDTLKTLNVSQEDLQALEGLWKELELIRFAPAQAQKEDMVRLHQEVRARLKKIHGSLKKSSVQLGVALAVGTTLAVVFGSVLYAVNVQELFQKGAQSYQEGNFSAAMQSFEGIARELPKNALVEYNLGNAAYKLGRTGEAVAHWIRAWRMRPRDADIRFNLTLITAQLNDPFFPDNLFLRWLKIVYYGLNLNELTVLFWLCLWIAAGGWIYGFLVKEELINVKNSALLIGLVLVGAWWSVRTYSEIAEKSGIVAIDQAEVRSGPGYQFGVGFTAPAGRCVMILKEIPNSDWIEVGIPKEGLKGWIQRDHVFPI